MKQSKYMEFIKNNIPGSVTIQLKSVIRAPEGVYRGYRKLGLAATKNIGLSVVDSYSRSVLVQLEFIEAVLVFCPVSVSPSVFDNRLRGKILGVVDSEYSDGDLEQMHEDRKDRFYKGLKGKPFKLEKL